MSYNVDIVRNYLPSIKQGSDLNRALQTLENVELAHTDSQQLKPSIALVLDMAEQLFLEEGQFDTLKKYCDLLAQRAGI